MLKERVCTSSDQEIFHQRLRRMIYLFRLKGLI